MNPPNGAPQPQQPVYVSTNTYNPYAQYTQAPQPAQLPPETAQPPIIQQVPNPQPSSFIQQPQHYQMPPPPSNTNLQASNHQIQQQVMPQSHPVQFQHITPANAPTQGSPHTMKHPSTNAAQYSLLNTTGVPKPSKVHSHGRLRYDDDVTIAESSTFISIINPHQGRAHVILRTKKDIKAGISNNLHEFTSGQRKEFWDIVQETVHRLGVPSILCHHFGGWRSADHFHVHIVLESRTFSEISSRLSRTPIDSNTVQELITKKSDSLKTRYMGFKAGELPIIDEEARKEKQSQALESMEFQMQQGMEEPPMEESRERMGVLQSIHGFRLEYDSVYPRVYFIPERPITYSTDPKEALQQLTNNRKDCFEAIYSLANYHNLKDFRIWTHLSGDPLRLNDNRSKENQIVGLLQVYSPDYYFVSPQPQQWLLNFKNAGEEPLSCI